MSETKYVVKFTTQFKKDFKLAMKRGFKIDGGQARHLQYGRRDVPYGSCGEDPRNGSAGDSL